MASDSQIRIVGGSQAAEGAYPYQVALFRRGRFICGGSIVGASTVVTAGHCVVDDAAFLTPRQVAAATDFTVGYGSTTLNATTKVQVGQIDVPSPYVSGTDESYDVARLTLASPIPFGPSAQPIALAGAAQSKTSGEATVTGWGDTTENGTISQQLLETKLQLRDDAPCQGTYGGEYVAARSVCAGGTGADPANNNPDTCQGDSGGPLAVDDGAGVSRLVLLGVTSYGDGCGRANTPGVYAWIQGAGIPEFLAGLPIANPAPAPAQISPAPAAPATPRDLTRPTLRYSKFSCTRKRHCTVRVRAADNGGLVPKLSARVSRRVRRCTRHGGRKRCRTVTSSKTLKTKRASGGFSATGTLARGAYTFTAVGTDASGNRSKILRRTLHVTR